MYLTIIIPTINGKKLLEKSLPVLVNALQDIHKHEIVAVDNNSRDGTENFLKTNYPKIEFIKLKKNKGFTGAVNAGAKRTKGEYLLILNNDCLVERDTITKMINFLDKKKQVVATQPIIYKYGTGEIENIGYMVDLYIGKAKVVTDPNFQFSIHNFRWNRYLYGLSATCLLIRQDIFVKIGMFDESFHSYLEDVDLFFRLSKKGYHYRPTLSAKCLHLHMATSKRMGLYKQKQDFKNWIRIIVKHYTLPFILRHFPSLGIERLRNLNGIIKKLVK